MSRNCQSDTPKDSLPSEISFFITDESGNLLLSFPQSGIGKRNVFSDGSISHKGIMLLREHICFQSGLSKVLVRDEKNGGTLLALGNMFPSARVILFIVSELDCSVLAALAEYTGASDIAFEKTDKEIKDNLKEDAFPAFRKLLSLPELIFPIQARGAYPLASDIEKSVSVVAGMCKCDVKTTFAGLYRTIRDNFDSSLFVFFLFVQLSIASAYSDRRLAEVSVFPCESYLTVKVTYAQTQHKCERKNFRRVPPEAFRNALMHLHSVADRLNLPLSEIGGTNPYAVFSPVRRDFSLLGLKQRPSLDVSAEKTEEKISSFLTLVAEETDVSEEKAEIQGEE